MRTTLLVCAMLSAAASLPVQAGQNQNIIRTTATIGVSNNDSQFWQTIDAYASDWENHGREHSCSDWSPDPMTQTIGVAFLQTQTCAQDQERTTQARQQNGKTGDIRDVGVAEKENRTVDTNHSRQAVGALESWIATSSVYGAWQNSGSPYNCSNWSPSAAPYTASATFTQTATDCSQNQIRSVQTREQETTTGEVRNVGAATSDSQTLTGQSLQRYYEVLIGPWQNTASEPLNCSNWAPDPSTVAWGTVYNQTSSKCTMPQVRNRTESYFDPALSTYVRASKTLEQQNAVVSNSRSATGTKMNYFYDANNNVSCLKQTQNGASLWVATLTVEGKMLQQSSNASSGICFLTGQYLRGSDNALYAVGPTQGTATATSIMKSVAKSN